MEIRLEPVGLKRGGEVRRFEERNRAFFAVRVNDRGDRYFEHFHDLFARLVDEHESGTSLLYLVVATAEDAVIGRVNVLDIDEPGRTEIGFRIDEGAQGQGVASGAVMLALAEAARRGVHTVRARAATDNIGSRRVLERCGFVCTGPAQPPAGSNRLFVGYVKRLC